MTIFNRTTIARRMTAAAVPALTVMLASATPASAALPVGAQAPDFTLTSALGGKESPFSLNQKLRKGPVVLYFFPALFRPWF